MRTNLSILPWKYERPNNELSLGVIMNGLLCSNVLAPNENGDTSPEGVNLFTLGLKSRISDAGIPSIIGKSLVYLSKVYELTLNMSPVVALDT